MVHNHGPEEGPGLKVHEVLPWVCPEHPEAQIRHEYTRTRSEVNWGPNRPRHLMSQTDSEHVFRCHACGRQLAPDSDVVR